MPLSTLTVGAAVTPTVIKTYLSHYSDRKPRHQKPTAHISYDEGLHLIRSFLTFASHHTVEELQSFTAQWVPHPRWVKVDNITVPTEQVTEAAEVLIEQLGPRDLYKIGGTKWWQWRQTGGELKAEWIEMRAHYNERERKNEKCKRVMLYVHGGAYFFGSVDEHRYQMQRHARKLKARVLAPRYRLAPQFPFPCGLQDCLAAYLYLLTVQRPSEIILAGDSAGGGMAVSLLCVLRDRGIPLPAGAILISPWVDLTHSFPSLGGDDSFDYIPAHGFVQKPSPSWPPPNEDDMRAIKKGVVGKNSTEPFPRMSAEPDAVQGFAFVESTANNHEEPAPGKGQNLSIELDGRLVEVKDQIQMYTTNQLISHPLVSPVLQPSLGGLPPILILTGGGEVLRDEQIFLAHKAANPSNPQYQLGDIYKAEYDHDGKLAERWSHKPTPVQLQVWEDLCHVAPTLSFTRPAKFMYRSVAQFGAWALARAQGVGVEIVDDDDISVISSGSDTESENENMEDSADSFARVKRSLKSKLVRAHVGDAKEIGKAGDPIPAFKNHMIRQKVDRHGIVYPLEKELPALQMDPNGVGVIKPGPVRRWMEAKAQWDGKYASAKRRVQKRRMKEMLSGNSFGQGENPPPSALAGRKSGNEKVKKGKKSMGLSLWTLWGSKHDENTMKREEEVFSESTGRSRRGTSASALREGLGVRVEERVLGRRISAAVEELPAIATEGGGADGENIKTRNRRRTVTVVDRGQVEGLSPAIRGTGAIGEEADAEGSSVGNEPPGQGEVPNSPANSGLLSPALFIPTFASIMSQDGLRDDASTTAVFAASGVMQRSSEEREVLSNGWTTPSSRRSIERLLSHQVVPEGDRVARQQAMRNLSSVAVVGREGVVRVCHGEAGGVEGSEHQRV